MGKKEQSPMDPKEIETPTPEELNAEQEAQKDFNESEVRTKLAEEMGIDPETEGELLDKIVAREKNSSEKLSGAIKQKIKWRTRAEEKFKDTTPEKGKKSDKDKDQNQTSSPEEVAAMVDKKVSERMEERDLKELALPEAIETDVKNLAKLKGISVREAAKDPYIVFKVEEAKRQERLNNSSPMRTSKGSSVKVSVDVSKPLDPSAFDFDTPEGVKAWNEAKQARAEYEKTH